MPYNRYKNEYFKTPRKRKSISEKNFKELVKVLDPIFSEYIRLKYSSDNGFVQCITCGKILFWKDVDNGHYIGRKHYATRFDERNCRPQCSWCNSRMEGQHFLFRQKLVDIYGEDEIKKMELFASSKSENCDSLRCKIIEYREKVKQLKLEKGL